MTENIPPEEDLKSEPDAREAPAPGFALHEEDRLDSLSWYLVVLGFISILLSGLCFYLAQIRYRDYVLNATALGRYLLFAGILAYGVGRMISYYKRYRRRARKVP